jgi:hypothetical protein
LRDHLHPVFDLLQAFGNDAFTGLHSVVDYPEAAHAIARLDGSHRHDVVAPDYRHLVLTLGFLHRLLRDHQRARLGFVRGAYLGVLAGTQNRIRIWEESLNLDSSSLDVDLAVHPVEVAGIFVGRSVTENQLKIRLTLCVAGGLMLLDAIGGLQLLPVLIGKFTLIGFTCETVVSRVAGVTRSPT